MVCTGFTKKLSIISSIDVKRLLRTLRRLCLFFSTVKRKVSCALTKISRLLYYKQIIAAARGILDNFEISLAVLLPNTTTSHAINYTNRLQIIIFSTNKLWQDWLLLF